MKNGLSGKQTSLAAVVLTQFIRVYCVFPFQEFQVIARSLTLNKSTLRTVVINDNYTNWKKKIERNIMEATQPSFWN